MLTYNEVYNKIKNEPCNLLLGAGFSIAFSDKMRLVEDEYFQHDLNDNEKEKKYRNKNEDFKNHKNDGAFISGNSIHLDKKRTIYEDLSLYHPDGICKISKEEAEHCFKFLKRYLETGKVFTLNYDLMLYWASIRAVKYSNELYEDGFDKLNSTRNGWSWNDDSNINVYYCHGALNLYSSNSKCYKSSHDQLCFLPLRNKIDNNQLPLCVSEPTSKRKLDVINKNNYLSACLRALEEIKGSLIIIGFSANYNDSHILDALKRAQVQTGVRIFYGLYTKGKDWGNVKERVEKSGLKVGFFDSCTARIWR